MRITVTLDPGLERYARALAEVPAKARRAFVEGLNEGGDKERTLDRRALKDQTGVKRYGTIVEHTSTRRAGAGGLEYVISGTGKGLPIKEFPVSAGAGPVTAQPWNVGHTFARSFKTSRQGLLRARRGSSRMPIRALYGPSIAKEIVKDETASVFNATAAPLVETAVFKRLGRLLP